MRVFPAVLLMLAAFGATAPAWAQAKDNLVVDLPGDVATMDPHLQWDTESYTVYRNIFDNLVTRDVSGKIVPQVATAWRYTDDTHHRVRPAHGYRVPGRQPAHAGRCGLPRPPHHQSGASRARSSRSSTRSHPPRSPGPAQVTLHTKTPYPALMAQLVKLSIVPKAYVEKVGDQKFNQEPIGSGPYRLRAWQRGVQSVLDGVDSYWRGKPPFRTVTFRAVPDGPTRIADLRTGRADITRGLSARRRRCVKSRTSLCNSCRSPPSASPTCSSTRWRRRPRTSASARRSPWRSTATRIISALQQGYAKPVNIVLTPANFGYVADVPGWPLRSRPRPCADQGGRRRGRDAELHHLARL